MLAHWRTVQPADLPAMIAMCHEHAAFEKAPPLQLEFEQLSQILFREQSIFCEVLEVHGTLVGYATYMVQHATWTASRYLYMDCLFILPEFRGQQFGQQLLQLLRMKAQQLGCTALQWQTPIWNHDAIRFYQRQGATGSEKLRFTLDLKSQQDFA